jgi:hypothetical protein
MNALNAVIYHTDFFDIVDVDMDKEKLNYCLEKLCKSDEDYHEFKANKSVFETINTVSKIFSFFIIPAIISLPLYFWSKRKLEVISAAETWHQVKIEVLNKNWDEAINHLNKLINPEIQQHLNTTNTLRGGNIFNLRSYWSKWDCLLSIF